MMKLGLHAWRLPSQMTLDETLALCKETGMASIEFLTQAGFKQGVELELDAAGRAEVKKKCADAGIAVAAMAILDKYDMPDEKERRANIDRSKKFVDLARDIGAPKIRALGDSLHEDAEPREKTIARVAESLRELAGFAEPHGVEIDLEMHNKFTPVDVCLPAVEQANHPNLGLVHNSFLVPEDMPGGSARPAWDRVKKHVRHVHFHQLQSPKFPYGEWVRLLRDEGYDGYCSLELPESQDPVTVLQLTRALFEAYLAG